MCRAVNEEEMTNDQTPMTNELCARRLIRCWSLVLGHWSFALLVGCSSSVKIAPVSGRVTLDGKPLAGVHVSFQPIAKAGDVNPGGGSYAVTDADGKFTLLLVEGEQPGAVIGKHRVEITARSEPIPANVDLAKRPAPKVFVPEKYGRKSELTFEVPAGGTKEANFELKSQQDFRF
jgi:hypothetical protein